ncbi:hypothetical protein KP509_23G015900 [Ceratopteris richardii]|nr:hypothetical protein KP509_23G015900 [Ceratopteris richardii]
MTENSGPESTEFESRCHSPISLPRLLSALIEPISFDDALDIFSRACKQEGFELCTDDVNQIARVWASKYALEDLRGRVNLDISMFPEPTWATIMITSNLMNTPQLTINIFVKLRERNLVLSQLSYEPYLFALLKCHQLNVVRLTLREMLASHIFPGPKVLGLSLDAFCKAGNLKEAQKYVQDASKLSPVSFQESAYSRLVTAISKKSSSMALDLFHNMRTKGLTPDHHAYSTCVQLLCSMQRFEEAEKVLKDLLESGQPLDPSTYRRLIHVLYKNRKPKEVLEIMEQLQKEGATFDQKTLTASLSCLFSVGRYGDAVKNFEAMQKNTDYEDPVLYYVMIKKLCDIGDVKLAIELKKSMNAKGITTDARLYEILQQCLCKGSSYVNELLFLVEEVKSRGLSPIVESYVTLAMHFYSQGDYDTARCFAEEMVKEGYKPTPYMKVKLPELHDIFNIGAS